MVSDTNADEGGAAHMEDVRGGEAEGKVVHPSEAEFDLGLHIAASDSGRQTAKALVHPPQ